MQNEQVDTKGSFNMAAQMRIAKDREVIAAQLVSFRQDLADAGRKYREGGFKQHLMVFTKDLSVKTKEEAAALEATDEFKKLQAACADVLDGRGVEVHITPPVKGALSTLVINVKNDSIEFQNVIKKSKSSVRQGLPIGGYLAS